MPMKEFALLGAIGPLVLFLLALTVLPAMLSYLTKLPSKTKIVMDSGWVSADGNEILLTGNVKIVQEGDERGPGGTMQSQRMRILLDQSSERTGLLF